MKILLLGSGSYKSSLTYYRLVAIAQQLAAKQQDVSIIVPSADKYNNFTPDRHAKLEGIKLIQPWQLVTKSVMLNLVPYLFTSLIHILRSRADVVYIFKPTPITILGLVPKYLFRKPVIVDFDDLGSEVMRLQGQSGLQVKLVALCEQLAMRFATSVTVGSTYLESLVKAQYPNKQVLVLSNGVNPAEFPVAASRNLRHAIYYFGALNRLELIEDLLRALPTTIKAVPDTLVTILGGGSALEDAKALVQELGISEYVTFTGWVGMYDVLKYVQFGDIAVCMQPDISTVRAASNLKVFQYMSLGSVPVVSDVGDLKSCVQNGKAGAVVRAGDSQQLSETLVALLNDPARRTRLAQQARNRAEKVYSWDHLTDGLLNFIGQKTGAKTTTTVGGGHEK